MRSLEDLEAMFAAGMTSWQKTIVMRHARIMGLKLVREAKRQTRVDTGNLQRHWFFRVEESGGVRIWVLNDAEYAAYVNNGHRIVRGGHTVGFVPGKHMLENAVEEYREKHMKQDVEDMLEDLRRAMR
jgi:hypothetical protein